jgi:O-antigen/teichoic acid export membrane protein
VLGSTIGSTVSSVLNAWVLFHQDPWLLPSPDAFHFAAAKRVLHLGLMFFVLQCGVTIGYSSDNIVISQILGAAAVAAYAVPQKLFGPISLLVSMAISPLWPAYGEALARGDLSWVRRIFFSSLWLVLGISVSTCTLMALIGPRILNLFFGKQLHVPLSLLLALAGWGVVNSVSTVISVFLNGAGVLKEQMALIAVVSPFNLGLSIFLTKHFGVMGVSLGSALSQLLITLPVYSVLIRRVFSRATTSAPRLHFVSATDDGA